MDADYLVSPAVFLVDTLFSLYVFALMLRFLLQWVEADFYNPISQFLVKLTHPPLRLLRRFIPSIGRIDTASVVLMFLLQMLGGYLVFMLQGLGVGLLVLAVWSVGQLIELLFNLYLFAIIIAAILSWLTPRTYNPAASLLYSLTEPVLRFFRRISPPIGGVDLSPMIALIAIQLTKMIILPPIQQLMVMVK